MPKAKIFANGRSQAIRLPKDFRVRTTEVYLRKTPDGFLVTPRDPWDILLEGVAALSDDFLSAPRCQPAAEHRNG